ncbi:MAG: O-antigen ligase family protein [Erythrobacter sp.]
MPNYRPAPARSQSLTPIYLAATLVYLLFIPEQFNVRAAGLLLSPYRIFMFGATIYLLFNTIGGRYRPAWPDLFVGLSVFWIWIASFVTSGSIATTLAQGGSHTLDIAFAYLVARASIQTPKDLRLLLVLIAPGLAVIGFVLVQEAVTHVRFVQPIAASLTGAPELLRDDVRLGFLRGAGPFPHPILAGIFMASFLALYLTSGLRGWPKFLGIAAACTAFFSMSSAALLGLLAGAAFLSYQWLTEKVVNLTWQLLLSAGAAFYIVIELTSNSGFYNLLIRYASLNTATAYNRVLIWDFGTENIKQHPWFGIGYDDWVRPDWMHSGSFDHFWLIMALRFGIPASIFLLVMVVAGVTLLSRTSVLLPLADRRLLRGVAISFGVFAMGLNSVSIWLTVLVWFFMLAGIAVSLGLYRPPPATRYVYRPNGSGPPKGGEQQGGRPTGVPMRAGRPQRRVQQGYAARPGSRPMRPAPTADNSPAE